jgi:hypothetical protein
MVPPENVIINDRAASETVSSYPSIQPRRRYRPRRDRFIYAVQLDLDTPGFWYRKWGARQRCKRRDWLVSNDGETYTIDAKVFARTYRRVRPGTYVKITPVWAERAGRAGSIRTKEGRSRYRAGDYIVFNHRNGRDGYCMTARKFKSLYRADD